MYNLKNLSDKSPNFSQYPPPQKKIITKMSSPVFTAFQVEDYAKILSMTPMCYSIIQMCNKVEIVWIKQKCREY